MSLIVRLQGLPAVANSVDIREFFAGLSIPRGGVYITGGKYGEAYIVFGTYEEARCALNLSGRVLKDSYIRLTYSSEEEMRCALEAYQIGLKPAVGTAYNPEVNRRTPDKRTASSFSYIYVQGMPVKATKVEIREFFRGLLVEDVLFLRFANGIRNGNAIVKFGRSADACEGLKLHNLPICGSAVTIKLSNEIEWIKNGGEPVVNRSPRRYSSRERRRSRSRSRGRYRSRSRGRYRSRSRGRYRSRSRDRYRRRTRTRSRSRYRSRSPYGRSRHRSRSPYVREYYVHIINLSYRADRDHLKMFFFDLTMKDSQITFLVDKEGKRTREGFVMFTTEKDYRKALSLDNELFKGHRVTILPISKKDMNGLIDRMKVRLCKVAVEKEKEKSEKSESRSSKEKRCLYVRNFAFDVTRKDVKKFFTGNTVKEDAIFLLLDNKGVGLGEALIKFANEKEASKAEKENCQTYLGIKILMSRITEEQMKSLQANKTEESIVTEADDMPDFTSDSIPDLTPSVEPDLTSDLLPKPAPSVEPDFTSDSIPDLTPSVEPDLTSDLLPKPAPSVEPDFTSDSLPDVAPSVEPDFTSDSLPDVAPSVEPDFTSDPLPDPAPSVETPSVPVNGESSALEANEVVKQSDSETVPPSNIESETMGGSDIVQKTTLIQDNTEEPPNDEKVASVKSEVTLLFMRNLPTSVTAAEILDFFHDFKVISVNLKNIERGIATLRMPNFATAVSAIETLHKKEVGQKQVFLTLI